MLASNCSSGNSSANTIRSTTISSSHNINDNKIAYTCGARTSHNVL